MENKFTKLPLEDQYIILNIFIQLEKNPYKEELNNLIADKIGFDIILDIMEGAIRNSMNDPIGSLEQEAQLFANIVNSIYSKVE